MHHSLQIMFILPFMTGHLFWKATILGGLYRGVPLYTHIRDPNMVMTMAQDNLALDGARPSVVTVLTGRKVSKIFPALQGF